MQHLTYSLGDTVWVVLDKNIKEGRIVDLVCIDGYYRATVEFAEGAQRDFLISELCNVLIQAQAQLESWDEEED